MSTVLHLWMYRCKHKNVLILENKTCLLQYKRKKALIWLTDSGERGLEAPGVDTEKPVLSFNPIKPFCPADSGQDMSPIEMWLKTRSKETNQVLVSVLVGGWGQRVSFLPIF